MLHKSVKFAYVVMALFSTTMAFLVMQTLDEISIPGVSGVVRINDSEDIANSAQVTAMVESFAREHGVTVGRELADVDHPDQVRHLYLAVGDPDTAPATWLQDGYPGFSRAVSTEVHPITEIDDRDPRGYYYLFGSAEAAPDLLDRFEALGLHGWQAPASPLAQSIRHFGYGALAWCVLIMALVVIVLVGSGVVLNTRAYGIHRLHGHSFTRVFGQDLAGLGRYLLGVAAVVAPATSAALFAYNRLHQSPTYALIALGFFAGFAGLALAVHAVTLGLVHRIRILGALKGEVPATWAMGGSYLIRIPALAVALAATVSVVVSGAQVTAQRAELATWSSAGDAVYLLLNGSLGEDTTDLEQVVGQWIRQSAERGQVILAYQEPPGASPLSPPTGSPWETLVVNSSYLDAQPVLAPTGHRVTGPAPGDGPIRVLVPERYAAAQPQIVAATEEWASFRAVR